MSSGSTDARLEATLGISQEVARGQAVQVRFTLTNHTQEELRVLRWYTPLEGFAGDIFDVERDGEPVPYRGILAKRGEKTVIGSDCLIMAYAHVAHDCMLGDRVILANNVNLAGHVIIEDFAILEGLVGVQQYIHIGCHSFIAGGSLVRKNVPPFVKAAREPLSYAGVNSIGLKRRGFSAEQIKHIQDIYRILFVKGYNITHALERIEKEVEKSDEREIILEFIRNADPGIMRGFQQINGNNVNRD